MAGPRALEETGPLQHGGLLGHGMELGLGTHAQGTT